MKGMKPALFSLMLLWGLQVSAALEQLLSTYGYQPIKMVKLSTGHDTIEVSINNQTGIFVVDTGAISLINQSLLGKYGIKQPKLHGIETAGAGGRIEVDFYPIAGMKVGSWRLQQQQIGSTGLAEVTGGIFRATGVLIDGIVGQDVLVAAHAILDVGGQKLFIQDHQSVVKGDIGTVSEVLNQHLSQQGYQELTLFPIEFRTLGFEFLAVKMAIDNIAGALVVDSGASRSFIHLGRLDKYQLKPAAGSVRQNSAGAGGAFNTQGLEIPTLQLDGTELAVGSISAADLSAVVDHIEQRTGVVVDGVVGQDMMMRNQAIINVAGRNIYVKTGQ